MRNMPSDEYRTVVAVVRGGGAGDGAGAGRTLLCPEVKASRALTHVHVSNASGGWFVFSGNVSKIQKIANIQLPAGQRSTDVSFELY